MVMLASFIQPILIDGKFQGIVGADLSVNFIQDLLKAADAQLYNGAGELALIANNGRLVAYTKDESKFGEKASEVLPAAEAAGLSKTSGDTLRYDLDREAGQIRLFLPFQIGETAHVLIAGADKAEAVLAASRRLSDTLY